MSLYIWPFPLNILYFRHIHVGACRSKLFHWKYLIIVCNMNPSLSMLYEPYSFFVVTKRKSFVCVSVYKTRVFPRFMSSKWLKRFTRVALQGWKSYLLLHTKLKLYKWELQRAGFHRKWGPVVPETIWAGSETASQDFSGPPRHAQSSERPSP